MRFLYVRYQDITCLGRDSCIILAKEFPLPFNDQNGKLAVKVMGMDRKNNSGTKVEIYNPEIG
jgi:hypothetical protein